MSKEPCGCESNDTHWTKLCPTHEAERKGREHELKLDSLQWLINHYEQFPNEDNLRHVVIRLKQVGRDAYSRSDIVDWIKSRQVVIKATIVRLAKSPEG
jgi:hypothetical protein